MPDARLARARRSLPEGYQFPTPEPEPWTLAEVLDALPRLVHRCHFVTDPETGITSRVYEPQRFEVGAWNVIEGEHDVPQQPLSTPSAGLDD